MSALKKQLFALLDRIFSNQLDRTIEFYGSDELKFDQYGNPVYLDDHEQLK